MLRSLIFALILIFYSSICFAETCKKTALDVMEQSDGLLSAVMIPLGIFSIFFLPSCTHIELKNDPVVSSIDSNYNTIETDCGQRNIGLNTCIVKKDQSTKSVDLKVRTIQSGTLSLYSEVCGIDWATKYSKSTFIKVPLDQLIGEKFKKSCLLSLAMSPEYDDQEDSTVKVHGFKGQVLIKIVDSKLATINTPQGAWNGVYPVQLRKPPISIAEISRDVTVDVGGSEKGVYRIDGCFTGETGRYSKNLTINPSQFSKSCIYHGAIVPADKDHDLQFAFMVSLFENDYLKLSKPNLIKDGRDLILDFEPEVTFVEVGDKSYNKTQVSIQRYDPSKRYEVRAYTVKGRYILGIHENGDWIWYQ